MKTLVAILMLASTSVFASGRIVTEEAYNFGTINRWIPRVGLLIDEQLGDSNIYFNSKTIYGKGRQQYDVLSKYWEFKQMLEAHLADDKVIVGIGYEGTVIQEWNQTNHSSIAELSIKMW